MTSQYQTKEERRNMLDGYPKTYLFDTPESLVVYFSGERIICLRCGKAYKTLGVHLLRIHDMTPDEYRDIYGIPWSYGLSSLPTHEMHSEDAKQKHITGEWTASSDQAKMARLAYASNHRKRQPVRDVLSARNIERMNQGKTGEKAARRKLATKRGTPEFKAIMRARPQAKITAEILRTYWKGRKQTEKHKAKRIAAGLETRRKKREIV